ncbi:hypothetical protein CK203_061786 [Vitis vinifera]|uniref:C2 domain-containing protein n=1 Tax=Vitis vinifera TaxID=29760 RepID=A0A438GB12_VITVI|nr:hypothetical protein CK203_061786 [Vitis vinifera]
MLREKHRNLRIEKDGYQFDLLDVKAIPQTERTSPVDTEGETNPAWNFTTGYTIGKKAVEYQGIMLVIELYGSRTLGDRYIGEVSVSFKDLFGWQWPPEAALLDFKKPLSGHEYGCAGTILVKVIAEVAFGRGLDDRIFPSLERCSD